MEWVWGRTDGWGFHEANVIPKLYHLWRGWRNSEVDIYIIIHIFYYRQTIFHEPSFMDTLYYSLTQCQSRYAMTSSVTALTGSSDPCSAANCGPHSRCLVSGDSYRSIFGLYRIKRLLIIDDRHTQCRIIMNFAFIGKMLVSPTRFYGSVGHQLTSNKVCFQKF